MANPFDVFDNPVTRGARDVGVAFSLGANGLVKMAGDLATLTTGKKTALSELAQKNIEYLQRQKSPELIAAEQEREAAVSAEENPVYQAWSYIKSTASNPLLAATSAAETAPSSVGAGALGAGARMAAGKLLAKKGSEFATKAGVATALGAGTAMQAADVGGDQFDELLKTLGGMDDDTAMQIPQVADLVQNKGSSIAEAKGAVALDLARKTAFGAGAVSAVSQLAPGGRTIERALVGGTKKAAGQTLGRTLLAGAKGAAGEATQESFEEAGGQVAKNILARPVEPERELTAGVGPAVGQAVMGAGALGGAAGIAQGTPSRPSPQPAPEGQTTAGKTGEAPASAATKNALAGAPEVALENSEGLTPEQFFAAVNIRQARLLGGEADPEDVRTAGEVPPPKTLIDPEEMRAAVDETQKALNDWKSQNPNAPENIVIVFDPEMLHNNYGIQGAFNPRDGSIFINSAFVAPENVGKIASHEWAHQTLATPEGQQAFADFVQREIPQGELDALATRYGTQDRRVLLEEWIAENQEKAPGVIERIVARIREWLAGVGIVDLSDAEAADIMLRTLRQRAENRIQPDTFEGMQPAEGERFSLSAEPKRISGVMASPSITDINYDRAKRNLTSANQARFKSQISEYAPEAEIFDAVGDWADGSENSVAAIFQDRKSGDELQRLAAQVGLAGDQKAVLWWRTEPEGADAIHEMVWPKSVSMDEARQAMIDVGLENRTLIQTPEGVRGFVFDQGRQNLNKIEALNEHETQPSLESSPAAGDFLGSWTSRAEGRRAYRRVLGSTPQAEAGAGELRSGEVGGVRDRGEPEARFSLTDRVAQGRDTVLATEAQKLKRGETTPAKYARKVEQRMPLRPFDEVPEPATDEDILRGLGNRMAGETLKRELKANPEDIEGQQVEARLDIPSYEDANVWTVTLHNPRERAGAAGKVLAYTPTAVLRDVTFTVNETAAMNVAAGARKSSFATMDGTYVPATAQSAYEQAVEAKESGDWVEIGMNPIRHSYFYDKSDQRPVVSAEEVIQVGGLVLGRGVQYGEKSDQKFSLSEEPVEQQVEETEEEVEETDSNLVTGDEAERERDDLPPTSALNTLYSEKSSISLPEQGKRTNGQVAEQLRQAALKHWGRKLDSSNLTPEETDGIVDNGVEEVLAGLKASNHAGNWYTTAIRKAMAIASVLHPELRDDTLAQKSGFKDAKAAEVGLSLAMAITSQNLNVEKNTEYANEQFQILKETGRFDPSKEYGSKMEAISGNLQLANTLLNKVGWDGVEPFLNREYTVKELNEIASEVLGQEVSIAGKVDDVVNGSAIFGPKIGGGFFQNLRANFNPVTVDLWMRRTWGRWTGDVLPEPLDARRLARMLEGMRESGIQLPEQLRSIRTVLATEGRKVPTLTEKAAQRILSDPDKVNAAYDFAAEQDSRWNKLYSEVRQNITPEQAEAIRAGELSLEQLNRQQQKSLREKRDAWQAVEDRPSGSSKEGRDAQKKFFEEMDAKAGRTAKLTNKELSKFKPEWAKSSRVITTLLKPVDVPSDLDRRVIVDVVNRIRTELQSRGVNATNADIQAILWYPEKDIWAKLAGKKESKLKSSYDEEFLRVAEAQGLGNEARDAAGRVGN